MDKFKDNEIGKFREYMLKYSNEVIGVRYDTDMFHGIYKEISEEIGVEGALAMHRMFKGTQVCFPIRFLDKQCIREMIIKEYDGKNIKALAKKYDYSEKTVRRIIKENSEKEK